MPAIAYCGSLYGQTVAGDAYREGNTGPVNRANYHTSPRLDRARMPSGIAEGLNSVYLTEREDELRALCSPEVCEALSRGRVRLKSFRDFSHDRG